MSNTASPSAPAPVPRPRRGPPAPALPPTPPGPVAGNPIGPTKKAIGDIPEMPPGIPAHIAQGLTGVRRPGVGAAPAVAPTPERPLHPTFAGPNAAARQLRQRAENLRNTALNAVTNIRTWNEGLKGQIASLKATPSGIAAATNEGLDLDLLTKFQEQLALALALTEPA